MTRQDVRPAAGRWLPAVAVVTLLSAALLVGGRAAAALAQDAPPPPPAATEEGAPAPARKAGAAKKPAKPAAGKAGNTKKKKKKPTTGPVAADDKFIVPYIGDNTFIVARLDVARVDAAGLEQFVAQATTQAGHSLQIVTGGDGREAPLDLNAGAARLRDRMARFTKAGGRHVYMLVDGDLWSPETVVVVPLRKGADAKALGAVLAEVNEGTSDAVDEVGKALVSTSRSKIVSLNARLNAAAAGGGKRGEGSDRPDLPAAFAAAGDAPLRISLVPGPSFRHAVGFRMHSLPEGWGGGDPMILAKGTRWITLAVNQKPATHLALTVQASNADSATKLEAMLNGGLARLKADAEPDAETKSLRTKHLEAVKVARQDTTVTATLDGAFFQRGLPDPMLMAMRTRFVLIDESDGDLPGRPSRGGPPGSPGSPTSPGGSQPPANPPPPATTPPPPPKPAEEGDGLD